MGSDLPEAFVSDSNRTRNQLKAAVRMPCKEDRLYISFVTFLSIPQPLCVIQPGIKTKFAGSQTAFIGIVLKALFFKRWLLVLAKNCINTKMYWRYSFFPIPTFLYFLERFIYFPYLLTFLKQILLGFPNVKRKEKSDLK